MGTTEGTTFPSLVLPTSSFIRLMNSCHAALRRLLPSLSAVSHSRTAAATLLGGGQAKLPPLPSHPPTPSTPPTQSPSCSQAFWMEGWKERKESGEDNLRVKSQQTFPFDPGECLLCHCGGKKNHYSPIQVTPHPPPRRTSWSSPLTCGGR